MCSFGGFRSLETNVFVSFQTFSLSLTCIPDQMKSLSHLKLFSWFVLNRRPDIVDIKPANMEELTEVITAAEFHPTECNIFVYSSSKGTIRLCDMRSQALCDQHAKCKYKPAWLNFYSIINAITQQY